MRAKHQFGTGLRPLAAFLLLLVFAGIAQAFLIVENERLALTNSDGNPIFDAALISGDVYGVQIGRSGPLTPPTTRVDADLIVYDPNEPGPTERAFDFNASLSDLRIGSGSMANSGDDGDIDLEDGFGRLTIQLEGLDGGIVLGITGQDGDLQLRNTANAVTIQMDGQTGNITNSLNGNGLVKAWARIRGDGTVEDCFRCNTSATETRRLGLGFYEVDFTPLATNIRSRPRLATVDVHSVNNNPLRGFISLAHRAGDASSVLVRTTNANGDFMDRWFVVMVF